MRHYYRGLFGNILRQTTLVNGVILAGTLCSHFMAISTCVDSQIIMQGTVMDNFFTNYSYLICGNY